jgi:uncharacterized protein
MPRFTKTLRIAAPAAEVFAWHERPGAFERLTPPWEPVRVVERRGGIRDGDRLVMQMGKPPATMRWVAEHRDYRPGESFRDVQVKGPFARWVHTHRVEPDGPEACRLIDDIEYELPLAAVAEPLAGGFVRARLERMFRYRHTVTEQDIAAHRRHKGDRSMKILVSGSSGLIGSTLIPFLTTGDHSVARLVRKQGAQGVYWNPAAGELDAAKLEGFDAVVHLAGDNISEGRWTAAKKKRIRDSRVKGTRLLAEALAKLTKKPSVFVCASAIGYYGDRGAEALDENAAAGDGFLADVCVDWEKAAEPARKAGIRVVHLRIGPVLAADGGALDKMLLPFKLGLGGVVGSGDQYFSWVTVDDVVGIILFAIENQDISGPVNTVAPNPVTNRELTKTLGKVLSRPTIMPVPAFALRLALGEMADELLLASTRVIPTKLERAGYSFRFANLEPALRHLLGA